jgi:hypothetical protein
MKKMVFCIIPLILAIMGCASSGTAVTEANGSSPGMDLDVAIREAAMQMEAKIPSKTMVALVSVASPSAAFSTQVLTRLESAIVSSGKLVVVDRANLDKVREEQGFQLSGEVDDESAKSIGKLLGAGAIVTGSLADLGDVYSLTLKAINIETATVAVSYLADLTKSTRIETLLASGGGGVGSGTRTIQTGGSTPSVATSVAPVGVTKDSYAIGDTGPAGGIIFYVNPNVEDWTYLEAAPVRTETSMRWGNVSVKGTGDGIGEGKKNTELIVATLNDQGENGAAFFCDDLEVNGYDDWFLPSKAELNLMYMRLKLKNLGGFKNKIYWSSSEIKDSYAYGSDSNAWNQSFDDGIQDYSATWYKSNAHLVRAIRAF